VTDLSRLRTFTELADSLLPAASHPQLQEAIQILAVNLAVYKNRYGEISEDEIVTSLCSGSIDQRMASVLADSMAQFCGVLRTVMATGEEGKTH